MKLRPEVEEALSEAESDCVDALYFRNADDQEAAQMRPSLLALVELGVKLGVQAAAQAMRDAGWADVPIFEIVDDLDDPDCIADILSAETKASEGAEPCQSGTTRARP